MQDLISAYLTFGNELYDENHRSTHKKSGRLTESPAAVSEQQHGDDESWDLHHRWQEIIQVRVSMKVCGVQNESIVRHGDDHPEEEKNTCKSDQVDQVDIWGKLQRTTEVNRSWWLKQHYSSLEYPEYYVFSSSSLLLPQSKKT